jgi:hypothetical protein
MEERDRPIELELCGIGAGDRKVHHTQILRGMRLGRRGKRGTAQGGGERRRDASTAAAAVGCAGTWVHCHRHH